MKEATYVAISTQKGGAGKTTLTVLVASYLHYVKGYNVAVVDCDFPQYSIHDMRKRDMKAVMEDGHYKVLAYEQLKRLKKNPYTIRCSRAEDAVKTAENLVAAQPDLDFVFFDLPGTINNADVVQTISQMDYIFTPIIADRVVMESSIKFATVINEQMISTGKSGIKGIYLVWNMVDGREKTELYKAYDKVCAEFALPILETHLPDSKRFRKETAAERKAVFRSTAFPADKILVRGSNLDKLVDEILGIIKTERHGKENKNRGHRQRSRNQLISTGRYKHSAGSEKHGRERSCPTSERSDTRSRFSTRLALQRGAGTQAQEQQAGKIGL